LEELEPSRTFFTVFEGAYSLCNRTDNFRCHIYASRTYVSRQRARYRETNGESHLGER
jgi:hypothetical protein